MLVYRAGIRHPPTEVSAVMGVIVVVLAILSLLGLA
jgi:hypothetical protein